MISKLHNNKNPALTDSDYEDSKFHLKVEKDVEFEHCNQN